MLISKSRKVIYETSKKVMKKEVFTRLLFVQCYLKKYCSNVCMYYKPHGFQLKVYFSCHVHQKFWHVSVSLPFRVLQFFQNLLFSVKSFSSDKVQFLQLFRFHRSSLLVKLFFFSVKSSDLVRILVQRRKTINRSWLISIYQSFHHLLKVFEIKF